MGVFEALLEPLDKALTSLLGQWNAYSTAIATVTAVVGTYHVFSRQEPDIHPALLARQAAASRVRQEGESSLYRSRYVPESMPLVSGLHVKDIGASKWSQGRDGDLRDIWNRFVAGPPGEDGPMTEQKSQILTVLGSEGVITHGHGVSLLSDNTVQLTNTFSDEVARQINLIGMNISRQGDRRVAIYLPNSVELMITLFACSFYDLTAIVLPFDRPDNRVIDMLRKSTPDTIITAPGSFPFDAVVRAYPSLGNLIWVLDEGNKHLDWDEVPKGVGGRVNVATWSDIISDGPPSAGTELPPGSGKPPKNIVTFWTGNPDESEEMVEFSLGNLAAGIAGQLSAIPLANRLCASDLFLPADSLSNIHTLILTLAALYSNCSVAFNSVAGGTDDLVLACQKIAPTVLAATPAMLARMHKEMIGKIRSPFSKMAHAMQTRSLVQLGVMPKASSNDSVHPVIGTTPGKLRLVFVAERAGAGTQTLSSSTLSDLRVFTGARIVYALSAARVAGAVTQCHMYDYRVFDDDKCSHFGSPLVSTEVLLRDKGHYKTTDRKAEGEVSKSYDLVSVHSGYIPNSQTCRSSSAGPVYLAVKRRLGLLGEFETTLHWP